MYDNTTNPQRAIKKGLQPSTKAPESQGNGASKGQKSINFIPKPCTPGRTLWSIETRSFSFPKDLGSIPGCGSWNPHFSFFRLVKTELARIFSFSFLNSNREKKFS